MLKYNDQVYIVYLPRPDLAKTGVSSSVEAAHHHLLAGSGTGWQVSLLLLVYISTCSRDMLILCQRNVRICSATMT